MSSPALIASNGDSLREAFGKTLSAIADEFPALVVLDADIAGQRIVAQKHAAPARLQPEHAAAGSGNADRAAAIRRMGKRHHARGNGRRCAA